MEGTDDKCCVPAIVEVSKLQFVCLAVTVLSFVSAMLTCHYKSAPNSWDWKLDKNYTCSPVALSKPSSKHQLLHVISPQERLVPLHIKRMAFTCFVEQVYSTLPILGCWLFVIQCSLFWLLVCYNHQPTALSDWLRISIPMERQYLPTASKRKMHLKISRSITLPP